MLKVYKPLTDTLLKEPEYFVAMTEQHSCILLRLVGDNGKSLPGGNLLTIDKKTGAVKFFDYINTAFGLDLDSNRRLKEIKSREVTDE